jgi:hypothetical protein
MAALFPKKFSFVKLCLDHRHWILACSLDTSAFLRILPPDMAYGWRCIVSFEQE